MRRTRIPLPAIPFLAVAVLLAGCASPDDQGIGVATGFNVLEVRAEDRRPAPSIAGPRLQPGEPITADLVKGKVAVVNFWGSWCGPCRREQPLLEAMAREYTARGVEFVGVNTRRDQETAARAFVEEFEVSYPSVYDPSSKIASAFRVRAMPTTFILDRQGRTAAVIVGAIRDEADLRALLDAEVAT